MADNPFDKGGVATATKTVTRKAKPEDGDAFDSVTADGEHKPGAAGDPFAAPSGISDFKMKDFLGQLLIVKPTEIIPTMDTENGPVENVVRADVVALDEGDSDEPVEVGVLVEDVLVFQMALKRALLKVVDGPKELLLGRLEMGRKKAGKNAPYIFTEANEDELKLARAWISAHQ